MLIRILLCSFGSSWSQFNIGSDNGWVSRVEEKFKKLPEQKQMGIQFIYIYVRHRGSIY